MSEKIEFIILHEDFLSSGCKNILDYIEQQNLKVHFHCRDGFCGACRTKLLKGEIDYDKEPLAFVRRGDFLPCCSTTKSDIHIEAETNDQ